MKISVITTTFNAAGTLRDCLESVKGQVYQDIEHIVIDGASTDRTLEILDEYKEILASVVSESDAGIYDALNKGIKMATGDVIGILHGDDLYASAGILGKVSSIFSDPNVGACYGDLIYFKDADGHMAQGTGPKVKKRLKYVFSLRLEPCAFSLIFYLYSPDIFSILTDCSVGGKFPHAGDVEY